MTLRSTLTFRGKPLGSDDCIKVSQSLYLWILAMEDLADPSGNQSLRSQLCQLLFKLHSCDLDLLVSMLKEMDTQWKHLYPNQSPFLDAFKGRHLGGKMYSGHLLAPLSTFADFSRSGARGSWNTILSFITRVNITLDIEDEMISDYLADEERLSALDLSDVSDLNRIMRSWFQNFNWTDAAPQHGPGGVAEWGSRPPVWQKYTTMGCDSRLLYHLRRDVMHWEEYYPKGAIELDRTSQVVFVPKSMTSYRTICKEPTVLQFYQQHLLKQLAEHMRAHPVISRHINLEKQELSRSFARKASQSGEFATIDLTRASDSVSYDLIKRVFRGTPILRGLIATRSDRVSLPNGRVIAIKKFAPMGSAVCFPIQCLLFAAICESCRPTSSSKQSGQYRIYGDDIIVHHTLVPALMTRLAQLGFLPNARKSFVEKQLPFRESCGGEYYAGIDVSPTRLPRNFEAISSPNAKPDMLVALCNTLFSAGLRATRATVLERLLSMRFPPYFSYEGGSGVWSYQPTNFHLKRKLVRGQLHLVAGGVKLRLKQSPADFEDVRCLELSYGWEPSRYRPYWNL